MGITKWVGLFLSVVGVTMVGVGIWLVYPPAALIVVGGYAVWEGMSLLDSA